MRSSLSVLAVVVLASAAVCSAAAITGRKRGDIRYVTPTVCDDSVTQYAGYVTIDPEAGVEYFFWFFGSRSATAATDPVALWMTGGPGCSGELALLVENGPCYIDDHLNVVANENSWNNVANMIYIDQPAGTGFSTGKKPSGLAHNESDVAADMYLFLQSFFAEFSQYQSNDFYITGESYGGHYVPSVSHRVWQGNQNKEGIHLNLKGISIGNGLTNPEIQYKYYGELAYNWSTQLVGVPRVSLEQYSQMQAAIPDCISLIQQCQTNTAMCPKAEDYCNAAEFNPYFASGYNPYDIRVKCVGGGLCYNFSAQTEWLNLPSVQKDIGVTKPWSICNDTVNAGFSYDWSKDFQTDVIPLLESGINVLIYAGDCGFICNWLGNKAWTLALDWSGKSAFNAAKDVSWDFAARNGTQMSGGIVRSASGLTFLQVYNAGHMVPMNVPYPALVFFETLINGANFPN